MCERCDNDGYYYEYRDIYPGMPPLLYSIKCKCGKNGVIKFESKIAASGVGENFSSKTFETFRDSTDELTYVKNKASDYSLSFSENQYNSNNSILICGKVGSGKTHLAAAISNRLMEMGFGLEYFEYRERIMKLKQINMDYEKYKKEMDKIKNAKVLFIDDLFKGKITEADTNAIYEVINNRYQRKMPIIITSERSYNDLLEIDEAIGSRILEMCKENIINISSIENYRLC